MMTQKQIIKIYTKLVRELMRYPSRVELMQAGVTRDVLRHHFGNLAKLLQAAKTTDPDSFSNLFTSEAFTKQRMRETKQELRESKEFIITTAVAGCGVFEEALAALNTWKRSTKGCIIMQPIADPARPRESSNLMFFDIALQDCHFIWEDCKLNNKVTISSILQSAKQLNPHTGLNRIVDNTGLTIIASPKRRLTPLANMENQPGYLFSGGAITLPDYTTDAYMSERTARFGEMEHVLGGVYVRIIGQNKYEFTNITFDKDTGEFCHAGKCYKADGTISDAKVKYLSFGDLHAEEMTDITHDAIKSIVEENRPEEVDIQDIFTGVSCSPFTSRRIELAYLESVENNTGTVVEDLCYVVDIIRSLFSKEYIKKINIVDSNHHHFLEYWITSGSYRRGDPRNIPFAHELAAKWLKNPEIPIIHTAMKIASSSLSPRCEFFSGVDSLKYAGVERLQHGHTDSGGRRNPPLSRLLEELGPCNAGHAHTSEIIGEAFRVGTMCGIASARPGYARRGANKWSQSYIKGYSNGQRQLIHVVR